MSIKIYHNPRCSKSRQTLAIMEQNNASPEVIEYLKQPPSAEELREILTLLKLKPRDLMRKNEQEYKDNNLGDETLSDEELIEAMCQHPKLIERPIIISGKHAVIGRPPEKVLELI